MIFAIHSAKPLMNAKWMWSDEDGISLICQCHEENEEPELIIRKDIKAYLYQTQLSVSAQIWHIL